MNQQPSSPTTAASASSSKTILGLRKLPARSAAWVMPLLLSVLMTFIVSLISTLRVAGLTPDAARVWMTSWALSWVVARSTAAHATPATR